MRDTGRAAALPSGVEPVCWDLEREGAPAGAMAEVTAVIHLAARAHRLGEVEDAHLADYHAANVTATAKLVRAAREGGVRRFVHVSSIKVLGEGAEGRLDDDPAVAPVGAYAVTKAEAEAVVRQECGAMEWTIVRPTFVYGAGGKGNFPRLLWLARLATRVPLPLASIRNRRSILYVENLSSLLIWCAESPRAAGQVLNAADSPGVTTPDLLRAMGRARGSRAWLFPFPLRMLDWLTRAMGRHAEWDRLSRSLEVSTAPLSRLGWTAPFDLHTALRRSMQQGEAHAAPAIPPARAGT